MEQKKFLFDTDKYKEEVDAYFKNAFESVEPQNLREKNTLFEEIIDAEIKRNQLLLNEPQTHDPNDQRASLYSQLLRVVREKRLNKVSYQKENPHLLYLVSK
jgi:hypothetical protein